ncbi:hypothetical protein DL1_02065 [Thioclava dalianensis]|uniref:Uncharacterized protein n=1 Tax=Thioclava dalianensis TaxID=1185766 RepID=A0A074TI89_9RHOB|nr:hypothetical protein DL1_02065 [Thioclava dalianensis]
MMTSGLLANQVYVETGNAQTAAVSASAAPAQTHFPLATLAVSSYDAQVRAGIGPRTLFLWPAGPSSTPALPRIKIQAKDDLNPPAGAPSQMKASGPDEDAEL